MLKHIRFAGRVLCAVLLAAASTVHAQIDPDSRQILHLGYNAPLNGNGPADAYAFYYWNLPNFPSTDIFLRPAIAPAYLDSETGFKGLLGENTDVGVGAFGGAFANSYQEVRGGMTLALAFQYNFGKVKMASDDAYEEWQKAEDTSNPENR